VTPEAAVTCLAEFVASRSGFTDENVYSAMADAGIPDLVADRAYKFTQTAWARVLLNRLGVRFSPEYRCLNGAGDVIESGLLAEQPYFIAAMSLAPRYAGTPGFKQLVLMSAEMDAINNALHAGSKPENLALGPVSFFMEPETQEAMAKAQILSAQRAASGGSAARGSAPARKAWWKLW
jgi:hypothetical protein